MQFIQVMLCYLLEGTEVKFVKLEKLKPTNKQTSFFTFSHFIPSFQIWLYIDFNQDQLHANVCPPFATHTEKMRIYCSFYSAISLWKKTCIFIKNHRASQNIRTAWAERDLEGSSNSNLHEKGSLDEVT